MLRDDKVLPLSIRRLILRSQLNDDIDSEALQAQIDYSSYHKRNKQNQEMFKKRADLHQKVRKKKIHFFDQLKVPPLKFSKEELIHIRKVDEEKQVKKEKGVKKEPRSHHKKTPLQPSNDKILKLYGSIDSTGNGWIDKNNNDIKLENILLDKFSKIEIEKINVETEDNKCLVCNQKLNNYWDYIKHIDLHNRPIPDYHFKHVHFCPVDICPMSIIGFCKKRDLRHHIHNHHFYRSNIVDKFKPWESVMRELSYNCIWTGCNSSFCRKDVLTRHIKLNHEKASEVKPGECYNCHTIKTSSWYKDPDGETICNACYQFQRKYNKLRPGVDRRLNATEGKKLVNINAGDYEKVFGSD